MSYIVVEPDETALIQPSLGDSELPVQLTNSHSGLTLRVDKAKSDLTLRLFSLKGEILLDYNKASLATGVHSIPMDKSLASGMYVVQLFADGLLSSGKIRL